MAKQMLSAAERTASISQLISTQTMAEETFASGRVPVEEEIKMRCQLAETFLQCHIHLQHPPFLNIASQHLETVLRRASEQSLDYPLYLDKLSEARMSEYILTGSEHALDLAVQSGHRAVDSANALDLRDRNLEAYLKVLTNLSFTLSRRDARPEDCSDLDIAIACMMEVSDIAPQGSDSQLISLNNLASQLRRRFAGTHDQDDLEEAERLTNQLLNFPGLNTLQRGMASGQLGFITYSKFKETGSLKDLDDALEYCKIGLEALPDGHEVRIDVLRVIIDLYEARQRMKSETENLAGLVNHSGPLLNSVSVSHPQWGKYLLQHLQHVVIYVTQVPSLECLEKNIPDLWEKMKVMEPEYDEREKCQVQFSNLLGIRYAVSMNKLILALAWGVVLLMRWWWMQI